MKLVEIKLPKILYHSSSEKFDKFKPHQAWFALSKKDAEGYHTYTGNPTITYKVEYTGGKIASLAEAKKVAQQVWPDEDMLYSMYDESVGEYDTKDVRKFIS